jgi:hypothetical protein
MINLKTIVDFHNEGTELIRLFGLIIYKSRIDDKSLQKIKDKVATIDVDNDKVIATLPHPKKTDWMTETKGHGIVTRSFDLKPWWEDNEDILEELKFHVSSYLNALRQFPVQARHTLKNDIMLYNIWANFSYAKDMQLRHIHEQDAISFCIYINNTPPENFPYSGSTQFWYGEEMQLSSSTYVFEPEEGDIIIFPHWLQHQMVPHSVPDAVRVSVAGNAYFNYQ